MAIGGKAEESGRDRVAIKNAIVTMIELAVKVISKRLTFHLFSAVILAGNSPRNPFTVPTRPLT